MIIIFGFRTPAASEIPVILYLGDDMDAAIKICETSAYPRIAQVNNPSVRKFKDWTEEASEAFEKTKKAKKLDAPVVANVHPHLEPGAIVYGSEGYKLALSFFVSVPKAKDLITQGYLPEDAKTIIARQQAMADAYELDDSLDQAALVAIADSVAPAPPVPQPEKPEEVESSASAGDDQGEPEADGLDDLTIDDLKAEAEGDNIELHGAKKKQDIIDIIRMYRSIYGANKLDGLINLATAEEVDVEGLKLKREFANAIVAHRRAK